MAKKKILVLATGGTIASEISDRGLKPHTSVKDIIDGSIPNMDLYEIDARDILTLDSSNIQPEEWQRIAQSVAELYEGYDGIVITHGTDTMAYTASALTYMLSNIPLPVVITGSQLPYLHPLTDATDNLRCAVAMAATGIPGVFIAFNRKVMLGCRAVKIRTSGFDAFDSINYPLIGSITSDGLEIAKQYIPDTQTESFHLQKDLCTDVFLLKMTPGMNPHIFDLLKDSDYKGILIEAFGAGGMHFIHRDMYKKIAELKNTNIAVVLTTQCLYEKSDLSKYEVGKMAVDSGVISAIDMTSEAAITKLMWVLARTSDAGVVREYFNQNIAGEVSITF
ncbi:MAG: asparaginase [Clostridia bacterium]|nr:asparaginase [Clostridia bacterium]